MNKKHTNIKPSIPVIPDNAEDNLTACELEILQLLQTINALPGLVEKTGRKKPNIHKTAQRLRFKGLAENRNGLYFITGYGIHVLKSNRYPGLDGDWKRITPIGKEKIRLHDVSFTIKFWKIPPGWNKMRGIVWGLSETVESPYIDLAREVKEYKNNPAFLGGGLQTLRFNDYTVICYASSIRVFIPEIISEHPESAAIEAWKSLRSFLPQLERWLRIPTQSLWSNRRLNIRISTSHYAWFESAFAKYMIKEKGATRYLVKDNAGNKRLLIDRSQGNYEMEATDPYYGLSDIELIGEIQRQYIEGEGILPKETKEAIDSIGSQVIHVDKSITEWRGEVLPVISDLSVNIKAHTGTAKANLIASERLIKASESLNHNMSKMERMTGSIINQDHHPLERRPPIKAGGLPTQVNHYEHPNEAWRNMLREKRKRALL